MRIVSLSRNFGKEIALTAGLDHADGDAVIPIDADLQHPPEVIAELVARWRDGSDIVIALRRDRATDGLLRRAASSLFHRVFARMTTVPVMRDAGDFRLMSRPVVDALRQLPERTRFMKGLYAWVGFRQTTVSYDIEPRLEGRSKLASGACGGWRSTASPRSARCRSRCGASSGWFSRWWRWPTASI